MVERYVVFETIKIGEELRKDPFKFDPPSYHSFFNNAQLLPIADVLPFHIVGGHITTSLDISDFEIMLANMEPEGVMSPPIRFKFSTSHGSIVSSQTHFLKLYPKMSGPDWLGEKRIILDRITHIYLFCVGGSINELDAIVRNDFLSMTLILERENE